MKIKKNSWHYRFFCYFDESLRSLKKGDEVSAPIYWLSLFFFPVIYLASMIYEVILIIYISIFNIILTLLLIGKIEILFRIRHGDGNKMYTDIEFECYKPAWGFFYPAFIWFIPALVYFNTTIVPKIFHLIVIEPSKNWQNWGVTTVLLIVSIIPTLWMMFFLYDKLLSQKVKKFIAEKKPCMVAKIED